MGLLTNILLFPISGPVAGIKWSLRKVQQVVDEELTDDSSIKQELMELQMRLELGEITEKEFAAFEKDILARLREIAEMKKGEQPDLKDMKVTGIEASFVSDDEE